MPDRKKSPQRMLESEMIERQRKRKKFKSSELDNFKRERAFGRRTFISSGNLDIVVT